MKRVLSALLVALCFSVWSGADAPVARAWIDYTVHLSPLSDDSIITLAVADSKLYVSTGTKLFLIAAEGTYAAATDVSARIRKEAKDEVTDIRVDVIRKELWVVLNGNTHVALCYDYDLRQKKCARAFLDQLLDLYRRISETRSSPSRSSVEILVYDSQQAVLGYFKGDVYLYSLASGTFHRIYQPTSISNWATAAVLTTATAFVVTRGDGLIAVDRKTTAAERFPNPEGISLRAIARHEQDLYLGATGLYRARVGDLENARAPPR